MLITDSSSRLLDTRFPQTRRRWMAPMEGESSTTRIQLLRHFHPSAAVPPYLSHFQIIVDRRADVFPMALTTTDYARSDCDKLVSNDRSGLQKLTTDPTTDDFAVMFEFICYTERTSAQTQKRTTTSES